MVVTGVSVKKHDTDGNLLFFDRETMDQLALMKVSDSVSSFFQDYSE